MFDFELLLARNLAHLLDMFAENPDAYLVAGATDFIPLVKVGKWQPRVAIDISHIEELRGGEVADGWLSLGALTTHEEAATSDLVQQHAAALAEACASVADPLIRSRATLGGNLGTASPAADSVPALLALGAELQLLHSGGARRIPLEAFLRGPGKTDLCPGEVLAKIYLPLPPPGSGSAFVKLGRRRAMAISVVNTAAAVQIQADKIASLQLAFGSVAPTVVRSRTAETALVGQSLASLDKEMLPMAVNHDIAPIDDVRASAAYRRQVAGVLAQRVLAQAIERARKTE